MSTGSEMSILIRMTAVICGRQEGDEMPYSPRKPCAHPGCSALVEAGRKYCDMHRSMHPEEVRSAESRGYGSRWRKVRKMYLNQHPLCVMCLKEGKYVKATDVDHIIAHRGNPELFWDQSNWQSLCHSHHSRKTNAEDRNPVYGY